FVVALEQVFEKKATESLLPEGPEVISRPNVEQGNQYQPRVEDADACKIAERPEMGHPLGGVVQHPDRYVAHCDTPPGSLDDDLHFKFELGSVKADSL